MRLDASFSALSGGGGTAPVRVVRGRTPMRREISFMTGEERAKRCSPSTSEAWGQEGGEKEWHIRTSYIRDPL